MTQQLTANDVRDEIAGMQCAIDNAGISADSSLASANYAMRNMGEWKRMLTAFADLLEAREKAVPVGYISAADIRELDANREDDAECAEAIEMLIASRPFASNHTAIYTHPDPADAERLEPPSNLQEALCVIENAALHGVTLHGDDIPRLRATVDRIAPAQQSQDAERLAEALRELVVACEEHDAMVSRIIGHPAGWNAQYLNSAREALAAHSARTPWTEGEKAHFKAAAELVAQREAAQAQPPAASVTDAMVCVWSEDEDGNWDTGCGNMFVLTEGTPYDNEMGFCCYCGHKLDQETQENAAMAKESGNG